MCYGTRERAYNRTFAYNPTRLTCVCNNTQLPTDVQRIGGIQISPHARKARGLRVNRAEGKRGTGNPTPMAPITELQNYGREAEAEGGIACMRATAEGGRRAARSPSRQMSQCPKMHPERVREEAIVALAGEGGTCTTRTITSTSTCGNKVVRRTRGDKHIIQPDSCSFESESSRSQMNLMCLRAFKDECPKPNASSTKHQR